MDELIVFVLIMFCVDRVYPSNLTRGSCSEGYAECTAGENWMSAIRGDKCIREMKVCNGRPDCSDGSDERYCSGDLEEGFHFKFVAGPCSGNFVLCRSGQHKHDGGLSDKRCLARSWICDDQQDCYDGSDEKYCPYDYYNGFKHVFKNDDCPKDHYMCENGIPNTPSISSTRCIEKSWICDGHKHCNDGSDENYCPYNFPDADGSKNATTLPTTQMMSDVETDVTTISSFSNPTTLKVVTTTTAGTTSALPTTVSASTFTLSSVNPAVTTSTYPSTTVSSTTSRSSPFSINQATSTPRSNSELIINPNQSSNLIQGSCTNGHVECKAGENWNKTSDRSKCISENQQCDGIHDCSDGSDESHCLNKKAGFVFYFVQGPCTRNSVMCASGTHKNHYDERDDRRCIYLTWVCDHEEDCNDGSDENFCPYDYNRGFNYIFKRGDCPNGYVKCKNGSIEISPNNPKDCIHESWICDRYEHCSDGSDELYCPYILPTVSTTTIPPPSTTSTTLKTTTASSNFTTENPKDLESATIGSESHGEKLRDESTWSNPIFIICIIVTLVCTVLILIIAVLYLYHLNRRCTHCTDSVKFSKLSSKTEILQRPLIQESTDC